jgi:hypothetical protein
VSPPDPTPPTYQAWEDPFEIDTTVAHAARRYNYCLGGTDNSEADRISGDAALAAFPTTRIAVTENRRFLRRVVRRDGETTAWFSSKIGMGNMEGKPSLVDLGWLADGRCHYVLAWAWARADSCSARRSTLPLWVSGMAATWAHREGTA